MRTNPPQKPNAVEVMADVVMASYGNQKDRNMVEDDIQIALAADPLRLALGEAAIQAILNKTAAVVPIDTVADLYERCGEEWGKDAVNRDRLDQPAKGDDHG